MPHMPRGGSKILAAHLRSTAHGARMARHRVHARMNLLPSIRLRVALSVDTVDCWGASSYELAHYCYVRCF